MDNREDKFKQRIIGQSKLVQRARARTVFPTEVTGATVLTKAYQSPVFDETVTNFSLAGTGSDHALQMVPTSSLTDYKLLTMQRLVTQTNLSNEVERSTPGAIDATFDNQVLSAIQSMEVAIDKIVFEGNSTYEVKGVLDTAYYKATRTAREDVGKLLTYAKTEFDTEGNEGEFRSLLSEGVGESSNNSPVNRTLLTSRAALNLIQKLNRQSSVNYIPSILSDVGIGSMFLSDSMGDNILIYENSPSKVKISFSKDIGGRSEIQNIHGNISQYIELGFYGFVPISKRELVKINLT